MIEMKKNWNRDHCKDAQHNDEDMDLLFDWKQDGFPRSCWSKVCKESASLKSYWLQWDVDVGYRG